MQNNTKLLGFKPTPESHRISDLVFYRSLCVIRFVTAQNKSRCLSLSRPWVRRHKNYLLWFSKRKG